MNDQLGILGTPHVGFFMLLIIGGLAGWIAGMLTSSRHGILTNILIGICGSFVGTKLAEVFNFYPAGLLPHVVVAIVGSVIVLALWRILHRPATI